MNSNDPAFPKSHDSNNPDTQGLTKREYFAAEAMKATIILDAIVNEGNGFTNNFDKMIKSVCVIADAQLKALEETK